MLQDSTNFDFILKNSSRTIVMKADNMCKLIKKTL